MSTLTSSGIERDGRPLLTLRETPHGARVCTGTFPFDLTATELRHVAALATEMAVNAERREVSRDRDLPAVGSFGGC